MKLPLVIGAFILGLGLGQFAPPRCITVKEFQKKCEPLGSGKYLYSCDKVIISVSCVEYKSEAQESKTERKDCVQ
jgi:hypothetical protein